MQPRSSLPPKPGRRRAAEPAWSSAARSLAGALLAVSGVVLGIGTVLWATDDPRSSLAVVQHETGERDVAAALPPGVDDPDAVAVEPDATPEPGVGTPTPASPGDPAAPPAAAPPAAAPPPVRTSRPPVTVLNNSRIPGLADRAAGRLRAAGWQVRETGNLRGRIRSTTVYHGPGQQAAARELARTVPGVRRVLPRFDRLPGSGLTVVVTRDFP